MTSVIVAPRTESPTSDTESVVTGGWFRLRPSKAYTAGGQWVLPVWSAPVNLAGAAITVKLDPLPSVPYELEVTAPDGNGGRFVLTEFRIVPDSGTAVKWEDLVQVAGPGGGSLPVSNVESRLAALEAALAEVSGGASNLGSITDMSALAKTLCAATTPGAMLEILTAAAADHTHGVEDIDATGTPDSSTFLRGDGSWSPTPAAGSPAWADITDKPATFAPSAHMHDSADIADATSTGLDVLTAADAAGARAALDVYGTDDEITPDNLPAATLMTADGDATARPTAREDVRVLWTADAPPAGSIDGDIWMNGPDV